MKTYYTPPQAQIVVFNTQSLMDDVITASTMNGDFSDGKNGAFEVDFY